MGLHLVCWANRDHGARGGDVLILGLAGVLGEIIDARPQILGESISRSRIWRDVGLITYRSHNRPIFKKNDGGRIKYPLQ